MHTYDDFYDSLKYGLIMSKIMNLILVSIIFQKVRELSEYSHTFSKRKDSDGSKIPSS